MIFNAVEESSQVFLLVDFGIETSYMENEKDTSNFPKGNNAQERGMPHFPQCYMLPLENRPSQDSEFTSLQTIDMARLLGGAHDRSIAVEEIGKACRQLGIFQIINHGISQKVLDEALVAASDFFELPTEQKTPLMSNDVNKPVRYSTSIKRVFLKHYANPLRQWIHLWPSNPSNYRENMGRYASELMSLSNEVTEAIMESLGLSPKYLGDKMKEGMQVMAVNCYPPCQQPHLSLGLPPHSDHSCITILLQSCPGLEFKSSKYGDGTWSAVLDTKGALQVIVGDHFEVLSNGLYKSSLHRATLNSEKTRISITSLHSLGMDVKMETAKKLVDEEHPKGYKESSFRDFLKFLSASDSTNGDSFIDILKITS